MIFLTQVSQTLPTLLKKLYTPLLFKGFVTISKVVKAMVYEEKELVDLSEEGSEKKVENAGIVKTDKYQMEEVNPLDLVKEVSESRKNFITAKDVEEGLVVVEILGIQRSYKITFFNSDSDGIPTTQPVIELKVKDARGNTGEYLLRVKTQNIINLVTAFGSDITKWTGQKLRLVVQPVGKSGNKMVVVSKE